MHGRVLDNSHLKMEREWDIEILFFEGTLTRDSIQNGSYNDWHTLTSKSKGLMWWSGRSSAATKQCRLPAIDWRKPIMRLYKALPPTTKKKGLGYKYEKKIESLNFPLRINIWEMPGLSLCRMNGYTYWNYVLVIFNYSKEIAKLYQNQAMTAPFKSSQSPTSRQPKNLNYWEHRKT
jgi:hypothetical protein